MFDTVKVSAWDVVRATHRICREAGDIYLSDAEIAGRIVKSEHPSFEILSVSHCDFSAHYIVEYEERFAD